MLTAAAQRVRLSARKAREFSLIHFFSRVDGSGKRAGEVGGRPWIHGRPHLDC